MRVVEWVERRQVWVYLGGIVVGVLVGVVVPGVGAGLERGINPVLGALLFVTFLQVPARELVRALGAGRFIGAVLVVNFVVVPVVVAGMFGFLPDEPAVRVGVLLVLLTPCVDYVIVFSGLAGGNSERLLAATPLLLLLQMLLLPVFLGSGVGDIVEVGPFLEAFVWLIVVPLGLAWGTQVWAGRHRAGEVFVRKAGGTMVPLMAATLFVVVASQVSELEGDVRVVVGVVPFFVLFPAVMAVLGVGVARVFRLGVRDGRAVVFSGATRNSLVVLPLALALPDAYDVAAVVVVTQTLVEVIGMVVYVRVVPRLLPSVGRAK